MPRLSKSADFHARLRQNADDYHYGVIGHATHGERNAAIWTAIRLAGPRVESRVLAMLRADIDAGHTFIGQDNSI